MRRDSGESYEEFLTTLANASGIGTPTRADSARIDRKRKKKGSNDDWTHPHDPDAKITNSNLRPSRARRRRSLSDPRGNGVCRGRDSGRTIELFGSQRRIVDVPFLSSTVKGVRIRHVEGCADLQPLRQVRVSQERFAE